MSKFIQAVWEVHSDADPEDAPIGPGEPGEFLSKKPIEPIALNQ
jgi:hypothetical protein